MKSVKIIITIVFVISSFSTMAQKTLQGDMNLNAGFGAGFSVGVGKLSLPPLGASLDYSLSNNLSVGGLVQYSQSTFNLTESNDFRYSYMIVGARVNYHFGNSDKLDPYVGGVLAYNIFKAKYIGSDATYEDFIPDVSVSAFLPGVHIGARYALSDRFGLFGEAGYTTTIVRLGVNFRLN